jgi:hypothetical protein
MDTVQQVPKTRVADPLHLGPNPDPVIQKKSDPDLTLKTKDLKNAFKADFSLLGGKNQSTGSESGSRKWEYSGSGKGFPKNSEESLESLRLHCTMSDDLLLYRYGTCVAATRRSGTG